MASLARGDRGMVHGGPAGGARTPGNSCSHHPFVRDTPPEVTMRGILLWLLGIPIPIILLLWLFGVLG